MKLAKLLASIVAMVSLNAAGVEPDETLLQPDTESSLYDKNFSRRFIPYIKLGPEMTSLGKQNTVMPGGGFGIRSESPTGAVDCSFSYAATTNDENGGTYHMFVPKLLYLKYLNSHSPSALFTGFGGTWAIIGDADAKNDFIGLAGVLSVGMEYNRNSRIREIFQCDIHQPLIGLEKRNKLLLPIVEFSFALGF